MLGLGEKLPKFSLKTQDGETITEKDFMGHYSILYFYPQDDTPGCTQEACDFTDNLPQFKQLSVPVYGVSPDDVASHKKFVENYKLKITLLADPEKKFCNAMGIIGEKNLYGKIIVGVLRSTFIIDPQGKVAEVYKNVRVKGHVARIQDRIQKLIKE